ncbi:MAG: hypothetical protein FWH36_00960 [Lentimicrobiaceae bacterium]|nr:hypothetical protein [Lentimicrobiaceae bacterium]
MRSLGGAASLIGCGGVVVTVLILLLFTSFQMKDNKEYVKYQTFDEYKLKGVGRFNIKEPYVLVKKELDTIFVIKSNDRSNVLKYINKGEFWYHQVPEEPQDDGITKSISKKFITNDTMFVFNHFPMPWSTFTTIVIETKKEVTVIEGCEILFDNEENVFKKIQNIASNYKNSLSYRDEKDGRPDNGWYQTFIKVYKGKQLYLYDVKDSNVHFGGIGE